MAKLDWVIKGWRVYDDDTYGGEDPYCVFKGDIPFRVPARRVFDQVTNHGYLWIPGVSASEFMGMAVGMRDTVSA